MNKLKTWEDGVLDTIKLIESRKDIAITLDYAPEYLEAVNEMIGLLRSMQRRGKYELY